MELLLIRHALPVRLETDGGPADPVLSEVGRAQAEALAHHWAGRIDAVWASPLLRARETAAPLAAAAGLPVEIDDDLAEMDRDSSYYVPIEELRDGDPRWEEAVASWVGPEAAELRATFRARVGAAVDRVVAAHPGQRVAVVCHGGTINAAIADVIGLPAALFFEPAYVSVNRVLASRAGARQLVSVNETWHVDGSVGAASPAPPVG